MKLPKFLKQSKALRGEVVGVDEEGTDPTRENLISNAALFEIIQWHDLHVTNNDVKLYDGYLQCLDDLVAALRGANELVIVGMVPVMQELRKNAIALQLNKR